MWEWLDWFWGVTARAAVVLAVLAASTFAGYAGWEALSDTNIGRAVREAMEQAGGWPGLLLPLRIYINNVVVSLVVLVTSVTLVVPLAVLVYNGLVIGYVVALATREAGMAAGEAGLLLLPHGVVELPAFAIAAGVALAAPRRGLGIYRDVLRVLPAVAALLAVAALVESIVTPLLAALAGSG